VYLLIRHIYRNIRYLFDSLLLEPMVEALAS
jgi:hypothetical protein